MFKKLFKTIYKFFETLPEKVYPFAVKAQGKLIRGRRAYEITLRKNEKEYRFAGMGMNLVIYRSVFHLIGSISFITLATIISHRFFGSDIALYVLFVAAVVALSMQEFYLHPKTYGQHKPKSFTDWFAWVFPMFLYITLFVI